MKFRAKVIPSGNATGVEIPTSVMKSLGSSPRPLIVAKVNGHSWRSNSLAPVILRHHRYVREAA